MKRFVAGSLFTILASQAGAVVIDAPGLYVINSNVDELIVNSSLNTSEVTIQVVSGGRVQNDVVCSGGAEHCNFRVSVLGNGTVMGRVRGTGAQIDIRDNGRVGFAGTQSNDGGRLTVSGSARVGTLSGAGSGVNGSWEINGGFIDRFVGGPSAFAMSMNGGIIDDSLYGWGLSLDLAGGEIRGDLRSEQHQLGLRMRGGHIAGDLIAGDGMRGFIESGSVDGDLRASFGGIFDIFGGQFGGSDSNALWWLGGGQVMNVHGRDLVLANGRLTGLLLDGSRLNVDVTFSQSFRGALNIHNVPEPGTLALFGVGLLGAFVARRKAKVAR